MSPAAIIKVMPRASVDQICQMCNLWEEQSSPNRELKIKPRKGSSSRRARGKRKKSRRRARSTSPAPVLDRMKDIAKTESNEPNLFGGGFADPSPVEGK